MSEAAPFIIWTFRRTGGTNLSSALFDRSPFDKAQHEPFNVERQFGKVTSDWLEKPDPVAMQAAVEEICQRRIVIKHCLEIIPEEINTALAKAAVAQGYRHVFLYRRNALDRLMSLHFASQSGVWGKEHLKNGEINEEIFAQGIPVQKLIAHESHCRTEMLRIYNLLRNENQQPLMLAFEDLYLNPDKTEAQRQVLNALQVLKLATDSQQDQAFAEKVLTGGEQGTRNHYSRFADYDRFSAALTALGDFEVGTNSDMEVIMPVTPGTELQKLQIWPTRSDTQAGNLVLEGIALLPAGASPAHSLLVTHAGGESMVDWNLPSPKIAAEFPANPHARSARFSVSGIPCGKQVCQLILLTPEGKRIALAKIDTH